MGSDVVTATPPELVRALPRSIAITGSGVFNICMALLFFAGSVALFYWLGNESLDIVRNRAALRANSILTVGTVTELRHVGRSHTPHVHYTFTVDGTFYFGESNVPGRLDSAFQPSYEISIRYLPSNPEVNHPADWENSTFSAWGPLLAPTVLLIVAIVMAVTQFRQRGLLVEGTPIMGTIISCTLYKGNYHLVHALQG